MQMRKKRPENAPGVSVQFFFFSCRSSYMVSGLNVTVSPIVANSYRQNLDLDAPSPEAFLPFSLPLTLPLPVVPLE